MSKRINEILDAIREGNSYTENTQSRIEAILKTISNGTEYTEAQKSRHEMLLVAIKNGITVNLLPRTRAEKILVSIANGTFEQYLSGKNLFDVSKIKSSDVIYNKGDGTLVIAGGSYYTRTRTTLRELCPMLKAGDTCFLDFETNSNVATLINAGVEWYAGTSKTLTDKMLDEHLILYGYSSQEERYGEACTISNFKIELGTAKTPYTPYAFKSELEEAYGLTADKLKGV